MSLTPEDLTQIRELVREEVSEEQDRFYERLKTGALSEIHEKLDSMAVDVARIPLIEAEVRHVNQDIGALRGHAGI